MRSVCVLGGGLTGLMMCAAFREIELDVVLYERRRLGKPGMRVPAEHGHVFAEPFVAFLENYCPEVLSELRALGAHLVVDGDLAIARSGSRMRLRKLYCRKSVVESVLAEYVRGIPLVDLRDSQSIEADDLPSDQVLAGVSERVGSFVSAVIDCGGHESRLRKRTSVSRSEDERDYYTVWFRSPEAFRLAADSYEAGTGACITARSDGELWAVTVARPRVDHSVERPSIDDVVSWCESYPNGREIVDRATPIREAKVVSYRKGANSYAGYSTWRGLTLRGVAAAGDALVQVSPILGIGASLAAQSAEFVARHVRWLVDEPTRFGRAWHQWQLNDVVPWFQSAVAASGSDSTGPPAWRALPDEAKLRARHLVR